MFKKCNFPSDVTNSFLSDVMCTILVLVYSDWENSAREYKYRIRKLLCQVISADHIFWSWLVTFICSSHMSTDELISRSSHKKVSHLPRGKLGNNWRAITGVGRQNGQ